MIIAIPPNEDVVVEHGLERDFAAGAGLQRRDGKARMRPGAQLQFGNDEISGPAAEAVELHRLRAEAQALRDEYTRKAAEAEKDIEAMKASAERNAAEIVEKVNGGNRTVPTLVYSDGTAMTNPSAKQVVEKLASLGL